MAFQIWEFDHYGGLIALGQEKFHGIFPSWGGFFSEDFHFYDYLDYYALITSDVMQSKAL
jgi:hypothetical protein